MLLQDEGEDKELVKQVAMQSKQPKQAKSTGTGTGTETGVAVAGKAAEGGGVQVRARLFLSGTRQLFYMLKVWRVKDYAHMMSGKMMKLKDTCLSK